MWTARTLFGLAALGLCWAPAQAQAPAPTVLIKQTDTIIGIGELVSITYVGVTNSQLWAAVVDTSYPDNFLDGALLLNGFVSLREGTTIFNPPGYTLDEWTSVNLTDDANLGMILTIRDVDANTKQGVFWNLVPVGLAGDVIEDPNVGIGTTWDRFDVIKMNTRGDIYVIGDVNNPSVTGAREKTLYHYRVGPQGNVLDQQVVATKGQFIPLLESPVKQFLPVEHSIALNNKGDYIVFVDGEFTRAVVINFDQIIAQEGQPSPIPNKPWKNLSLSRVGINDRKEYVHSGGIDSSSNSYLIVKNGAKFAREGEVIPSLSPAPLGNGSSAPIIIANNGDVFWVARVPTGNDCFARNYDCLVRQGDFVLGNLVTSVTAAENGFAVSPNGRFWVGRVELQGIGSTALMVDNGLVLELPGCLGINAGTMKLDSGRALVGNSFTLAIDNAQAPGAIPVLVFSTGPAFTNSDCGILTPYGELLFSPAGIRRYFVLPEWNGSPILRTFNVPNNMSIVNATFFAQTVFYDPPPALIQYRFTNGLRIELGAP